LAIANVFLVIRIRTEERMLMDQFGKEYEEYQKKTKKLIPFIY
jgi:protein-S-isoprenylcysteine O-methyltransferase Ste14